MLLSDDEVQAQLAALQMGQRAALPPQPTAYQRTQGYTQAIREGAARLNPARLVGLLDEDGKPKAATNPSSIGAAYAMTQMLPGAGYVQAWDDFGQGRDAIKRGEYGQAAIDYGRGTMNTVLETLPVTAMLPAIGGVRPAMSPPDMPVGPRPAAAMPDAISGGSGLNNYGKGERGMAAVPNLRGMSPDDAIVAARSEPHLIPSNLDSREGYYVSGPQSVKSPEDLAAMRAEFDRRVAAGAEGADWYGNAREFNREVAGSDPMRQRLIAHEEALWSAQANPDTNLGFALQGHNAYEAGVPMDKVRTGAQAQNYNSARDAGTMPTLGKKTGVYGQHLDPTVPYATTGTNDIWHARALGYLGKDGRPLSRAIQNSEHTFMDYETLLAADRANAVAAGGRTDWNGPRIQAAPWVGSKGEALAERSGGKMTTAQGIAEAAKTYPDYASKYTFSSTGEQIPGKSTGIRPGLIEASPAERQAFSDAATWKDADGRDTIYGDAGMWVRKTQDGTGRYVNSEGVTERNPVEVGRPLVSFKPGDKTAALQPHDRAMLDSGEATRGLLDAQEGAAGNMIVSKGPAGAQTAFHVNLGRQPTKSEMDVLAGIAQKHGYGVANSDDGVALIDFNFEKTGKDATKALKPLQKDIGKVFEGASVRRGRPETVYQDFSAEYAAENAGRGMATNVWMGEMERLRREAPGYFDKLLDSEGVSAKARANLARLDKAGGLADRPDYTALLRTVGEGKLRALYDRVKRSGSAGLPAIAVGALGASGARGLLEEDDAKY